jgi:hypothetical protein
MVGSARALELRLVRGSACERARVKSKLARGFRCARAARGCVVFVTSSEPLPRSAVFCAGGGLVPRRPCFLLALFGHTAKLGACFKRLVPRVRQVS